MTTSATANADIYSEISLEAQRDNLSDIGRPLPLASHWTTGAHPAAAGWAPAWQLTQIANGRHLIPWFALPLPEERDHSSFKFDFEVYAKDALRTACAHGLPLVFASTQWESVLTQAPYRDLPAEQNPDVLDDSGRVAEPVTISPFGPISQWHSVGLEWTTSAYMRQLQLWCPNPSLVIFLSNNEATKLDWTHVESDRRYTEKYGYERSDSFKRQVVGDAWIARYRALQAGMRAALTNPAWQRAAKFVGYNAFGPPEFGRWSGWQAYSLGSPHRVDPAPLAWDGGSPSYYIMNSTPETDYAAWSPQSEFQNLVFMQAEALRLNPHFWFELSVWDGYVPGGNSLKNGDRSDNRAYFASLGQVFTPERYKGFVQFGMWLNRPRAVREFRDWIQPRDAETEPYFFALMDAVDSVYKNPILKSYWRRGRLLPVPNYRHSYQSGIPAEYADKPRWFLLPTDANEFSAPGISTAAPANVATEINVFSLALETGKAPQRSWLVYAASPLRTRTEVRVTIPGYGRDITLRTVVAAGSFYEVVESSGHVEAISP